MQTEAPAPQTPLLDRVTDMGALRALSEDQLPTLAADLRAETVHSVARTGGHLGAGLGVVELTVALHYLFDTPKDTLIWDVGHQAYPHKILTGRRDQMPTLRQDGGLSGFCKRDESEFDAFGAGHSSTSLSAALGLAVAAQLRGDARRTVAVIGDGALTAGLAYEALNNIGASKAPLLVVVNDNGMSIAPNVGALVAHLNALADGTAATNLFTALGLAYHGPVDGHDMPALLAALTAARDATAHGPVVLHVRTQKGHGFAKADICAERAHASGPFNPVTGEVKKGPAPAAPTYTQVFGKTLTELARTHPRLVAITAAMPSGTGLDGFAKAYPDRFFDVGIAEQHAVTFAAGLAAGGAQPFVAIYSTFLQRAYDQIIHDVALQKLPVRFAIDRAGLVGADGATHHGAFDLAYLCAVPNLTVMAPADEAELAHMLATAAAHDGPIAVRYPRGEGTGVTLPAAPQPLPLGRGRLVRDGSVVAFLSLGTRLTDVLAAADRLAAHGLKVTVADARFAKPIDHRLVRELAMRHSVLITVEDGVDGGFGARVLEDLAHHDLMTDGLVVRTLGLPDTFIDHGKPGTLYASAGLHADALVNVALQSLNVTSGLSATA
jgi:1-deoxy-D-xylulose-5-phosphate synthase